MLALTIVFASLFLLISGIYLWQCYQGDRCRQDTKFSSFYTGVVAILLGSAVAFFSIFALYQEETRKVDELKQSNDIGYTGGFVSGGSNEKNWDSTYYFTECPYQHSFDIWLLLTNPNDKESVFVTVTLYPNDGEKISKDYDINPMCRKTIELNFRPEGDYWIEVVEKNKKPFICERAAYFKNESRTGGYLSVGLREKECSPIWYFAEGNVSPLSETIVSAVYIPKTDTEYDELICRITRLPDQDQSEEAVSIERPLIKNKRVHYNLGFDLNIKGSTAVMVEGIGKRDVDNDGELDEEYIDIYAERVMYFKYIPRYFREE
ncbi:MAG: hypothetical protein JW854_15300 [Actinobacteria bacterium]|nr:hypothetical protein [Actinomycetota bacterium]